MISRGQLGVLGHSLLLAAGVGMASGFASGAFLLLLDAATQLRERHEAIVYALPIAGAVLGVVYTRYGGPIRRGTDLVIDAIHDGGAKVPLRLFPMVLLGTVLTHLFGGSAGREGTAVQMGAAIADAVAHAVKVPRAVRGHLLAAGVAGGFGSVFGTPIAGTVFGLEFVAPGRIAYGAFAPSLVAALVGDAVTRAMGVHHTVYPTLARVELTAPMAAKWVVFAIAVALAAVAFTEITHGVKAFGERYLPSRPLRMAVGGLAVVIAWKLVGTSVYLGLGVPTIVASFSEGSVPPFAFAAKIVFTALTLGAGFLGGEVTPLFFVGAALGHTLAPVLGLPIELGAGVGLAAVFAAAANTPLALSIMAVELLGAEALPHVVLVSVVAYLLTGRRSIYPGQRLPQKPPESAPYN